MARCWALFTLLNTPDTSTTGFLPGAASQSIDWITRRAVATRRERELESSGKVHLLQCVLVGKATETESHVPAQFVVPCSCWLPVGSAIVLLPSIAVARQPFISQFTHVSTLASTVPASGPAPGDQNPDGAAVVPQTTGKLLRGDVLVSNFNNAENQQGTGSSIVEV